MAKVEIKTIKGNRYLYIKYKVRINSKSLPISLYVGRFEKTTLDEFSRKLGKLAEIRLTRHREYWMKKEHSYLNEEQITDIERLHFDYSRLKQFYPDETKLYQNNIYTRYVSGTTAIEGNTITQKEAQELMEHGLTPSGRSVREVYEIMNFTRLRPELSSFSGDLSESLIKRIHEILMWGVLESPGIDRRIQVLIEKARHEPPPAFEVEELMQGLVRWYDRNREKMHPFELAILLHTRFVTIHPFQEGNGRVARALMNFVLEKHGYPTLYFGLEERNAYLDAVTCGNDETYGPIIELMYDIYLKQHGPILQDIPDQKDEGGSPELEGLTEQFLKLKERG